MEGIENLQQRLNKIETQIEEARRRLPAHSVKPVLMAALFDLEDERDAILKQLEQHRTKTEDGCPCRSADQL